MYKSKELEKVKTIRHGFFGRNGGVSGGIYASLNCGPGSGDKADNVGKNREIAAKQLGVDGSALCTLYQCHSNKVIHVSDAANHDRNIQADAMVTDKKGICLGILTADCAPVLFADTKNAIIGAAHAGWRGAFGGILENTVAKMYKLGANNGDIVAAIGPCIGPKSYEVDAVFRENFIADDPENRRFFAFTTKKEKFLFDLPSYVEERLKRLGLASVSWIGEDTLANEKEFFSYRRNTMQSVTDYGRQLSAVVLV